MDMSGTLRCKFNGTGPVSQGRLDQLTHWLLRLCSRAKVERHLKLWGIALVELFSEREVAVQGV